MQPEIRTGWLGTIGALLSALKARVSVASRFDERPTPPDSVAWVRILRTPQEIQEARQRAAAYQARARAMLEGTRMHAREASQAPQAPDQPA
jgi:aspartate/methionine/tyrosine aminotransferase